MGDLLNELRTRRSDIDIEEASTKGAHPDTEFVVLFRAHDRPCLFGVRDRIWDEDSITAFGVERSVTDTWLRWEELLDTGELPHDCAPDDGGVTWVDLWAD